MIEEKTEDKLKEKKENNQEEDNIGVPQEESIEPVNVVKEEEEEKNIKEK